jgi:hypothetical protein
MKTLNESQTEHIIQWVKSQNISINSLENEFVDHICCEVEEMMNEGKGFANAFDSIQQKLGMNVLPELNKQTILYLTLNQRFMKFMTRLAGVIVLLSFFAAIILRFFGTDIWKTLMAGGMVVLSLGFVPLFFIDHYNRQEVKSQKVLHIFGFLAAFLIPLSAFLGLLNSPNSLTVMIAGTLFLLFGFIPLSWNSISKNSGRSVFTGSILFLLFFILLSFGFMGLKISKDRVNSWAFINTSTTNTIKAIEKLNSS